MKKDFQMVFTVPFIYEAEIITQGDNTPRLVSVLDRTEVEIAHHQKEDFTLAFSIGDIEYLWNGSVFIYGDAGSQNLFSLPSSELHERLNSVRFVTPGFKGLDEPTHFFTPYFALNIEGMGNARRSFLALATTQAGFCQTKESTEHLHWLRDSRKETIDEINKVSKQLVLIDGKVHKTTCEPSYSVFTLDSSYDKSNIHRTKAKLMLCITDSVLGHQRDHCVFNAEEYDVALEYIEKLRAKYDCCAGINKLSLLSVWKGKLILQSAQHHQIIVHNKGAVSLHMRDTC